MPRNLLILSDGTGLAGGVSPEIADSNVYKIFRATQGANIDPEKQTVFYDPGVGTVPGANPSLAHRLWAGFCGASGVGLTDNIIDCYTQIILRWRPGDRVFLFGFSRGAYTVRCVATVMRLCGVPTHENGQPLSADPERARVVATEAVKRVYQYVLSSLEPDEYVQHREELARLFRARYGSDRDGESNAYPYFIGVFDPVASIGNNEFLGVLLAGLLLIVLAASGVLWWFTSEFWRWVFWGIVAGAVVSCLLYLITHLKVARGLKARPVLRTLHFGRFRSALYDQSLTEKVEYARAALSIDESRNSFDRVRWGQRGKWRPGWLRQVWFAGNHSDIGGSYPNEESGLSDIALQWMVDEAKSVGLLWDDSAVQIAPDPAAMAHDARKSGVFRFARLNQRLLEESAELHPTVIARLESDSVLNAGVGDRYRPPGLRKHILCAPYFEVDDLLSGSGDAIAEAGKRAKTAADHWEKVVKEITRRTQKAATAKDPE